MKVNGLRGGTVPGLAWALPAELPAAAEELASLEKEHAWLGRMLEPCGRLQVAGRCAEVTFGLDTQPGTDRIVLEAGGRQQTAAQSRNPEQCWLMGVLV